MGTIFRGPAAKAGVLFLPMIDLPSSCESCLYSALMFLAEQGQKYRFVPILRFDHPLWWNSMKIIDNKKPGTILKKTALKLVDSIFS